jgi:flagellar hook-length control protein FliK
LVNAIQSVFGMVKSLLPIDTGGPLPLAPKLPDVSSFLENVSSMLQGLLGQSTEPPKAAEESKDSTPQSQAPAVDHASAPRDEPKVARKSDDQVVRDREQSQREAERRSREEPPTDGSGVQLEQIRRILEGMKSAAPAGSDRSAASGPGSSTREIQDLLQALDELKKRAGLPVEGAPDKTDGLVCTPPEAGVQPPVDGAVAAPAVEVPSSTVAESAAREVPSPTSEQDPAFALLAGVPAKEDVLSSTGDLTVNPPAGTDPMAAPAAFAAPMPVIVEAVSVQEVEVIERPTAARPGPAVGGITEFPSVATGPSGATPAAEVQEGPGDRAELVDRIVQAARLTQSRGSARIKIALNPPNLGELKVDLSIRQRVLHGTLQAESVAAKEMILSNLQSLKDSLEQQGIHVGEFQVLVDPSFQQAAQQDPDDGRPRSGAPSYAMDVSDPLGGSVGERVRSSRMQLFDVVA